MSREFKVLSLLQEHYKKVPQAVILCEDLSVMDAPFYIMERISGVILRPALAKEIKVPPDDMRKNFQKRLSIILCRCIPLISLKPVWISWENQKATSGARSMGGENDMFQAQTEKIDTLDSVMEWLSSHMPTETAPTLLHNDYKFDNLVLDANNLSSYRRRARLGNGHGG